MKKVIGGQGTGKTKELIELAHQENAIIVSANPDRMVGKVHGYGFIGIQCISYEEYIEARNDEASSAKYVVDDVEAFLNYISSGTIAFSVSNE